MTFSIFSMTLRAAVTFENCQAFPCFRIFFHLASFKKQKNSCVHQNVSCWRNLVYLSLFYFVVALTSAVTHLPNITLIFQDFPGLQNEICKFHDFSGFPWPVRTLRGFTDKIHYISFHLHRCNHEVVTKSPALKESYFVLKEVVVQWRYSRLQQTDKQHRTGRLHILEAAT